MKDKKTKIDNDMEDKERKTDDIISSEDNRLSEDNLLDSKSQDDSVSVKTIPWVIMKKTFGEAYDSTKKNQ